MRQLLSFTICFLSPLFAAPVRPRVWQPQHGGESGGRVLRGGIAMPDVRDREVTGK